MSVSILLLVLLSFEPNAPIDDGPWFSEHGSEIGLDFVHFNGMSGRLYIAEVFGSGGALLVG